MFNYVTDKEFISKMKQLCGSIMQDLCKCLKRDYDISATFYLVGSGARNLITQNAGGAIDLDYNLEIVRCDLQKEKDIKETVRKAFNQILTDYGWADCEDSTATLTTEKRHFIKGNTTEFSMDVAIVKRDSDDALFRLIHDKTGWISLDRYYWVKSHNSIGIREKATVLKKSGCWTDVRNEYLKIKNMYLRYNDYNHSSFVCYIEAVNNVYNRISNRR